MFLEIKDLHFAYKPQTPLLHDVNLTLKEGDIGVLLGGSGTGKTSLLRCLAGFETPTSGEIRVHDTTFFSAKENLAPHERQVGYLFQSLALFPHMTVEENVRYGIEDLPKAEQQQRLAELFELIGLEAHREKLPQQLSGGERQRVALARALAPKPKLLLMDEPFSSLDFSLRTHLRQDVRKILKSLGSTVLLVTHDYEEAYEMGDQVGILKHGRLVHWGLASETFELLNRQVPSLRNSIV